MSQTAAVFPGQGSQREGMGADFCREHALAREIYQQASDAIGVDLAAISFAEDDERLHLTEFTQPAILPNEIALLEVVKAALGWAPTRFAGHSLGEYTALVAAGALDFTDAVQLVHRRGALMQAAVPAGEGAMAAVKIAPPEEGQAQGVTAAQCMEMALSCDVDIANINSEYQFVISGLAEPVATAGRALERIAREGEIEVVPLAVSAPFHSRHMRVIESEFGDYLKQFPLNGRKAAAVLSNYTGDYHPEDAGAVRSSLVAQISGAVRWSDNMRRLIQDAASNIYEIGPGRPLGGFFHRDGHTPPPSIVTLRCLRKLKKQLVAGAAQS